jgi:hypothetical protein
MLDLWLRYEFDPGTDLNVAARSLRECLAALDTVAAVDARPENARITSLEIVGAIAVGVQIVRGSRQLVTEARRLIAEVKGMRGDIAGLRAVTLDGGPKLINVDDVTENELAKIIEESEKG